MALTSMRAPTAAALGATLMAWRAFELSPDYSVVQLEMMRWLLPGATLVLAGLLWELVRWYQHMDSRYSSGQV
jgi:hypothetical protein